MRLLCVGSMLAVVLACSTVASAGIDAHLSVSLDSEDPFVYADSNPYIGYGLGDFTASSEPWAFSFLGGSNFVLHIDHEEGVDVIQSSWGPEAGGVFQLSGPDGLTFLGQDYIGSGYGEEFTQIATHSYQTETTFSGRWSNGEWAVGHVFALQATGFHGDPVFQAKLDITTYTPEPSGLATLGLGVICWYRRRNLFSLSTSADS